MPKKYRAEITGTAEADVAEIWEQIAQDKPAATTTFVLQIEEQISTLEDSPERCPLVPENELLNLPPQRLSSAKYRDIVNRRGRVAKLTKKKEGQG